MIDVGGTGGAGLNRFNVAPAVMFILAAGGAVVVKHASRSGTARVSTENVLQEMGVPIHLPPLELKESLQRLGLGFVFAADYHPAFRAIVELRRPLALENVTTVLNLIGPLLNPGRPQRQLIGVFSPRLPPLFAQVLRELGRERAWIVHGLTDDDTGMDDVSTCGATTIAELEGEKITAAVLDVAWVGIPRATLADLRGGDAHQSAATIEGILSEKITGPMRHGDCQCCCWICRRRAGPRFECGNCPCSRPNRQRSRPGEIARGPKLFDANIFGPLRMRATRAVYPARALGGSPRLSPLVGVRRTFR